MGEPTVADVVLAAVRAVDAADAEGFELVVEAYARAPRAASRAHRARNQPTASAPGLAGETTSTLALAVGLELLGEFAPTSASARRPWWRPWARPGPDTPAVPLPEPDIARMRSRARELCLRRGASEQRAEALSDSLAGAWPRTVSL